MSFKRVLARAILTASAFERLSAIRSRRLQVRLLQRSGLLDAAARYVERFGCTVRHTGPLQVLFTPSMQH